MRRYLLVLDTDLLALDDRLGYEPINYLVEQQEREQSEVVVLSLAGQTKLSSLELALGAAASGSFAPAKFPVAPQPEHDLSAAAERRMNLTVRQLKTIGFRASGLISDEELVKAIDAETRSHDYDQPPQVRWPTENYPRRRRCPWETCLRWYHARSGWPPGKSCWPGRRN